MAANLSVLKGIRPLLISSLYLWVSVCISFVSCIIKGIKRPMIKAQNIIILRFKSYMGLNKKSKIFTSI